MDNNKTILLNAVIKNIYTIDDLDQFMKYLLDSLEPLIPNAGSSFYLGKDDEERPLFHPVARHITIEDMTEYMNVSIKSDFTRLHFMGGKSVVYKETDLYSEEVRKRADYYDLVFEKQSFIYSVHMGLSYNSGFLGLISLYRTDEYSDFDEEELFILDLLKDHIEYRLYREKTRNEGSDQKLSGEMTMIFDPNKYHEKFHLTYREIDVLKLLLDGYSNEDICTKLSITPSTTNKHTLNIYKKLGINHRWELIKFHNK